MKSVILYGVFVFDFEIHLKFITDKINIMGTVKSMAHLYSYNEYLHGYIQKGDVEKIEELLTKKPELIKDSLTRNSKVTALYKAAYLGNLELVKLFVEKYKADVNQPT